jgi:hypothetical protein
MTTTLTEAIDRVRRISFTLTDVENREAFDLVLEAARRQGPITDEWEYGYELIEQDTRDVLARGWPFNTWEEAMQHALGRAEEESDPDTLPLVPQVVRRREAGPWEPVEPEGSAS